MNVRTDGEDLVCTVCGLDIMVATACFRVRVSLTNPLRVDGPEEMKRVLEAKGVEDEY